MVNFRLLVSSLIICLLAACAPSAQAIQTAMAQTQEALPTLTPTTTAIPSATAIPSPPFNPCTNKGWNDIDTYINQYRHQDNSYVEGSDIDAYLDSLTNIKNKINETDVDACTEHAHQLIVTGLEKRIYADYLLLTGGDADDILSTVGIGNAMIEDATAELRKIGIYVNRPY